jgi:hypothetical protein
MDWLAANDCLAAQQFGWLVGAHTGAYVGLLAMAMLLSARAYRYGATRSGPSPRRAVAQLILRWLVWLVVVAWLISAFHVGRKFFFCYATWLAIGALVVAAPAVALLMLTAANRIGKWSVRS